MLLLNMKKFNLNDIPKQIPVFPLSSTIFFPNTILPLNIFEPRYKQMVEHAIKGDRLIGMIQTKKFIGEKQKSVLFDIGCVGYIESHFKTPDGRYLINLKGVSRFKIIKEIENGNLYREFNVDYLNFVNDFKDIKKENMKNIDVDELIDKTKKFFKLNQLSTDWKVVEKVSPDQLVNSLSMICPFSVGEKQRLLETLALEDRNTILNQIINFYLLGQATSNERIIH